jgi:hypothetical protein
MNSFCIVMSLNIRLGRYDALAFTAMLFTVSDGQPLTHRANPGLRLVEFQN